MAARWMQTGPAKAWGSKRSGPVQISRQIRSLVTQGLAMADDIKWSLDIKNGFQSCNHVGLIWSEQFGQFLGTSLHSFSNWEN